MAGAAAHTIYYRQANPKISMSCLQIGPISPRLDESWCSGQSVNRWPETGLEERSQLEVERGWEKCGIDLLETDFWGVSEISLSDHGLVARHNFRVARQPIISFPRVRSSSRFPLRKRNRQISIGEPRNWLPGR